MERRDHELERLIKKILEDEFGRSDILVSAYGRWYSRERAIWLQQGRHRVPVIPLRYTYNRIDEHRPPRIYEPIENFRAAASRDLARMVSQAISELRRRTDRSSSYDYTNRYSRVA